MDTLDGLATWKLTCSGQLVINLYYTQNAHERDIEDIVFYERVCARQSNESDDLGLLECGLKP